jgi:hypothetical protein
MNPFHYEQSVAELLESAAIPGLLVKTSALVTEAKFKTISKPTAIVALGDEAALAGNYRAVSAEVAVLVYLVLRGAAPERSDEDIFFREEIFQALHGVLLEGLNTELEWRSTMSDYEDNARTYLMTFAARLTKHKRVA